MAKKQTSGSGSSKKYNEGLFSFLQRYSRVSFLLIPLIIVIALSASIITQLFMISHANNLADDYTDRKIKIEKILSGDMKEANDLFTDDKIRRILTLGDIYVFTNSLWEYSFKINETEVDNSEIVISSDSNFVSIVFTEIKEPNPLPKSITRTGMVTRGDPADSIQKHISVKHESAQLTVLEEEYKKTLVFKIEGVKQGDKFEIEISDQLASKLGTPFNSFAVTVE